MPAERIIVARPWARYPRGGLSEKWAKVANFAGFKPEQTPLSILNVYVTIYHYYV
jgi:hypothetical protein